MKLYRLIGWLCCIHRNFEKFSPFKKMNDDPLFYQGDYRGDFPVIAHAPVTHIVHRNPTSEFTVGKYRERVHVYTTFVFLGQHELVND